MGELTDGFEYVAVKGDNVYVFNSAVGHIIKHCRESISEADWKVLKDLKVLFKDND